MYEEIESVGLKFKHFYKLVKEKEKNKLFGYFRKFKFSERGMWCFLVVSSIEPNLMD